MCGLKWDRLSTARLPWVAAMTYPGSSPISCATLPQAASTAEIESVRVPSYRRTKFRFMKGVIDEWKMQTISNKTASA